VTKEKNKLIKFSAIPKKARYLASSLFKLVEASHVNSTTNFDKQKTLANLKVYFPGTQQSVLIASAPELFESKELTVSKAREVSWRLAVNYSLLRKGLSVSPKAQVREHVALTKVTVVKIEKIKNRATLILTLTMLTGFLAGSVKTVRLPASYGPVLFRNAVNKLRFSYTYSPLLLGGLRFLVVVVPKEEGQDITNLSASASNKYINTKLTKARFRAISPCVHEDTQIVDCLLCLRGRQSCKLGITLYDRKPESGKTNEQ